MKCLKIPNCLFESGSLFFAERPEKIIFKVNALWFNCPSPGSDKLAAKNYDIAKSKV